MLTLDKYVYMLAKRTNILFEEAMWEKLELLAQKRETSVGELVREALRKTYNLSERQTNITRAFKIILSLRKKTPSKAKLSVSDYIIKMRDESLEKWKK